MYSECQVRSQIENPNNNHRRSVYNCQLHVLIQAAMARMLPRACVVPILLVLGGGLANAGNTDKYYHLTGLPIGSVVITDAHVSLAESPPPKERLPLSRSRTPSQTSVEKVETLEFDRGVVHIRVPGSATNTGDEIRADIAQAGDHDPTAKISGTFEWNNGILVRFTVDYLHLRLNHAASTSALFGGKLRLDTTLDMIIDNFIDNPTPIVITNGVSDGGRLALKVFGSQVVGPQLSLQGVAITTTLTSVSAVANVFAIDLASGNLQAINAAYSAKSGDAATPVTASIFAQDTISGGHLSIEGVQLLVDRGVPRLTIAAAHIARPVIHLKGYDTVPVVEAQEYVARNVIAEVSSGTALQFDAVHAAETFATANPWGVVNQLNSISAFSPEVLIPTGNPNLRYIRPADLGKLYAAFAGSDPDDRRITGIVIQQTDGIVTKVVVDLGRKETPKDSLQREHPVCVLVETLSGLAAGAAVDALFAEVPLYAATNVWLRVTNPLNPRFAVPSFVSTFRVSKGVIKLFGAGFDYNGLGFDGMAAALAGTVASQYCEVFLAKLPNRLVFSKPNYLLRPYLFETIQTSPDILFADDIAMHYQLYLGKTVKVSEVLADPRVRALMQGSERQVAVLKTFVDASQNLDAQAYERLAAEVREAQERDNLSLRQRRDAENQNMALSAAIGHRTVWQRGEDQRLDQERHNVNNAATDPNILVPGLPRLVPQPGGTTGKKGVPTGPCQPNVDECITISTPQPPKKDN